MTDLATTRRRTSATVHRWRARAARALTREGLAPPADADRVSLTVPAHARHVVTLRTAARAFAQRHGVPDPDDVALAVSEAVTNAVLHAYRPGAAGLIHFTASRARTTVTFAVQDHGRGLSPHPGSPGMGIGLGLMAQVADRFVISALPTGGTLVELTFPAAGR